MDNMDQVKADSLKSVLLPLLILTSVFYMNLVGRVIESPLMPLMEKDLGIGHAQAGGLFFFMYLGYCASLLCSSLAAAWLEHRRIIVITALWVGAAMLGIGLSSSLWGVRLGILNLGIAAGLYVPSAIASLTALVNPRLWGRAIAIHEIAPNLGYVSAPLIAEALLWWLSWREVMLTLGAASALAGLIFARFGQGGRFKGQAPRPEVMGQVIKNPGIWAVAGIFTIALGSGLGLYNLLPLFLVSEHAFDRPTANLLVSMSRLSGFVMIFVSGWLTDRLGPRRTLLAIIVTSGAATVLLGLVKGVWLLWLLFLQPALAACFFSPAFAALSFMSKPETRHLAVSLSLSFAIALGGGVFPAGIGFLGEMGHFGWGVTATGVMILGGLLICPFLKMPKDGI